MHPIAGQPFVLPVKVLACLKPFPFNVNPRLDQHCPCARPPFQKSGTSEQTLRGSTQRRIQPSTSRVQLYRPTHRRTHPLLPNNPLPSPPSSSPSPLLPKTALNPSSSLRIHLIGSAFASFLSPTSPSPFNFARLVGQRVLSISSLGPCACADVIARTENANSPCRITILTVTFIPYILLELPSNLWLQRIVGPGPNVLSPSMTVLWSIATIMQDVVTSYGGLHACRVFLSGLF
ncbi:hypothetical protein BDY19DRAFT_996862 [Irpex rosettiformis]|uniref:Uncharacterized protein n=1 Tax=Irpex rosettiformis TaxID=378272 RepID=A0ACB8TTM5_9APHY|nr:hypothetical protein BDY19DRAFT_996862 [Irpex rosettiformis]